VESKLTKKIKELTPQESYKKVKDLIKEKKKLSNKDFEPGNLIFTHYNAKFKENTYDQTPLVLVLRRSKKYTLGLNFHWILPNMRTNLVFAIMKMNKANIKRGRPLEFSYQDLKPMLKGLGYAPCIRLYINARFVAKGVVVPPERLMEISMMRTETFTNGKYSAADLFRKAKRSGRRKTK
jgi:hypothetical protein